MPREVMGSDRFSGMAGWRTLPLPEGDAGETLLTPDSVDGIHIVDAKDGERGSDQDR